MNDFTVFSADAEPTPLPEEFFLQLLPQITDLNELKVTIYALWFIFQQEGQHKFIRQQDFLSDESFMSGMKARAGEAGSALDIALMKAVKRGSLLAFVPKNTPEDPAFFANSERGRLTLEGLQAGQWTLDELPHTTAGLHKARPNIYKIYEENIGPLTPMIAEELLDAEKTYPAVWIRDAIQSAVEQNVRRWSYVNAILKTRMEREGNGTTRGEDQKNRRRYLEGKYGEFVER